MKPIKLKQDMEKYGDTNTLREEFIAKAYKGDFEISFSNTARNSYNEIADFFIHKFNQKLKDIEREIEKEKQPFKVSENTELRDAFNNGLDLALQIIKNKKNVSSLNPKETDGSQKCTCKDFKINNKCYWHGK